VNKETIEALTIAITARVPVLLWGAPGTGKTSVVKSIAESNSLHLETVLASVREPADFSGLPVIRDNGTVHFAPPMWAHNLCESKQHGLLFFDELSTAPPAVQGALLRVVLDRVVGDLALPQTVSIVAAANPPEIASGGWDLSAPLANRFLHLDWTSDGKVVAQGFAHGFRTPRLENDLVDAARLAFQRDRWSNLVSAYLHIRPEKHLELPTDSVNSGRAWASPRSWEMLITLLSHASARQASSGTIGRLVVGSLGSGSGIEFLTWADSMDLPDPEVLLDSADTCTFPTRHDQLYATLLGIVSAIRRQPTKRRWDSAWVILGRVAQTAALDLAALSAIELVHLQPRGAAPHKAMTKFASVLREAGLM